MKVVSKLTDVRSSVQDLFSKYGKDENYLMKPNVICFETTNESNLYIRYSNVTGFSYRKTGQRERDVSPEFMVDVVIEEELFRW